MISWQFTRVKQPLSPRRKNRLKISSKSKKKKCLDSRLKFVKNNNRLTKSRVLASRKISCRTIWANLRKRKPNTPSANNKLRKSNGKLATFPDLSNYSRTKRADSKKLLVLYKAKDSLLTSQSRMHPFNKSTSKSKNFSNKSERRKTHWLLNWKKESKSSKNSKRFKMSIRPRSNHFWASQLRSRMTLRTSKQLSLRLEMKFTQWTQKSS